MPFLDLQSGEHLHYLDPHPGHGHPVLLLHGLGASAESWQLQTPALIEAGFRPIALDIPGFGKSSPGKHVWTIKNTSDNVAKLLSILEIQSAHVVGISMGGTIALQVALDHPSLIDRLVLVSTFASLRPRQLGEWIYYLRRYLKARLQGLPSQAEFVSWRIFPKPEQAEMRQLFIIEVLQASPKVYDRAMRALILFDVTKRLMEIQRPTLVISGENDSTVPMDSQKVLAENVVSASQVIISDAGHAVTVDQPEQFNSVLINFLSARD